MKRISVRKKRVVVSIFLLVAFSVTAMTGFAPTATLADTPEYSCEKEEHVHTQECFAPQLRCELLEQAETPVPPDPAESTDSLEESAEVNGFDSVEDPTDATRSDSPEDPPYNDEDIPPVPDGFNEPVQDPATPQTDGHVHEDACYEQVLVCAMEEHTHTQECLAQPAEDERVYEDEGLIVRVTLPTDAGIPPEAELYVIPITIDDDQEKYFGLVDILKEQIVEEDKVINGVLFYDIGFLLDGMEIEPKVPIKVTITFKDAPAFPKESAQDASDLLLVHMTGQEEALEAEDVSQSMEAVEGVEEGITQFEFIADSFSIYALLLLDETVTGLFYQQVHEIDSTTDKYMIVAANGTNALTEASGLYPPYSTRAFMEPVKGNPGYYTTTANVTPNMLFQFTNAVGTAGTTSIISSLGHYIAPYSTSIFTSSANNVYVKYSPTAQWWRIATSSSSSAHCLSNNNAGFAPNNNSSIEKKAAYQDGYKNMVIFKQVDTTLHIPGDVTGRIGDGGDDEDPEEKPDYPDYLPVTSGETGESAIGKRAISYAFDNATSQIESILDGNPLDDGKVWADKSVVFGNDDYSAFSNYDEGVFGIALSALTQQYKSDEISTYDVPMDVVFLLDSSGSMNTEVNGEKPSQTTVNALNNSINHIMRLHPGNRVGVAQFSDEASQVLQLSRYFAAAGDDELPDFSNNNYTYFSLSGSIISANTNLRYADSARQKVPNTGDVLVKGGTYTQQGLQQAAQIFFNADPNYTLPNNEEVKRIPLLILLSDGMPTFGSPHYTDPLNGPHFGNGTDNRRYLGTDYWAEGSDGINAKGVLGYYTVLSANYFKRMIGIHYDHPAKFSTIGMGIYALEDNSNPYAEAIPNGLGDDYARAVLDPTADNLSITNANPSPPNNGIYGPQLYKLLTTATGMPRTVTVRNSADTYTTSVSAEINCPAGITNSVMPVIFNPYNNYSFNDYPYFGATFTTSRLTDIFNEVVNKAIEKKTNYAQSLKDNSMLTFYDKLGADMEIKSDFVLRYEGSNYPCHLLDSQQLPSGETVDTYRTTENFFVQNAAKNPVSLLTCTITVTTDISGRQTVKWEIPNDLLPAYRQSKDESFYFEMLPIRLLYQVGLREETLQNLQPGTTYYTNEWSDDTTYAVFEPHEYNPYYAQGQDVSDTSNKQPNITGTIASYVAAGRDGGEIRINMGNNGSITTGLATLDIEAQKIWQYPDGTQIEDLTGFPSITVQLYQSLGSGEPQPYGDAVSLGEHNGWQHTWYDLPADLLGSAYGYSYRVEELPDSDYEIDYENNGLLSSGKIIIKNKRSNTKVEVEKQWYDYFGQPDSGAGKPDVWVTLYRQLKTEGSSPELAPVDNNPIKLNQESQWRHAWENLPLKDENNVLYSYFVQEDALEDYVTTYKVGDNEETSEQSEDLSNPPGKAVITNKARADLCEVSVKKIWLDFHGNEIVDPSGLPQITVKLKQRLGFLPTGMTLEDNFDMVHWAVGENLVGEIQLSGDYLEHTWTRLPRSMFIEGGTLYYFYYVEETFLPGYTVSYSDNNVPQRTPDSAGIQGGSIEITNRMLNSTLLPETGGIGIWWFTAIGIFLMAFLPLSLYRHMRKGKNND